MEPKSINRLLTFILGAVLVVILALTTMATTAATQATDQAQSVEVRVERHLSSDAQFQDRVLSDLREIKADMKVLQKEIQGKSNRILP